MRCHLRMLGTLATVWLTCLALPLETAAAPKDRRPAKPPPAESSFTDLLQSADPSRWTAADGWTNGSPFDNAWSADNLTFADGNMVIRLDNTAQLGEPYTSGEYRTNGYYGYGCYEASFRPAPNAGLVSAFFTYAGPWDNGGNGQHNEIDIEFPGTTNSVQFNFWTNDDSYSSRNEFLFPLAFDASEDFHAYAFKWTAAGISWYIDGDRVYEVFDTLLNPTPKAAESLQKIMMNLWAVDQTAEAWAGTFVYPGTPVDAIYEWVRFTAGEDCEIGPAPVEPPPPEPVEATGLYVANLALSLNTRKTQGIASVTIRDSSGAPAANVTVSGDWSGIISSGDESRLTGSDGTATFYSGRSRDSGEITFCVTDLARSGDSYDAASNLETCKNIVK